MLKRRVAHWDCYPFIDDKHVMLHCRAPLRTSLLAATLGLGVFGRPAAAASFATQAAIIDQVTFKEMGLLSWLIVDVAIQWGGWAVSALLKVKMLLFQQSCCCLQHH